MVALQLLVVFVAGMVFRDYADIDFKATLESAIAFPQTYSNRPRAIPNTIPHPNRLSPFDNVCLRWSAPLVASPPAPLISSSTLLHPPRDTCPPLLPIELLTSTCPLQKFSPPRTMAAVSKTCPHLLPIELVDAPLAITIYGLAIVTRQHGFAPLAPEYLTAQRYPKNANHRPASTPGSEAATPSSQRPTTFEGVINIFVMSKKSAGNLLVALIIIIEFAVGLWLFNARILVTTPTENLDHLVRNLYTSTLLNQIYKLQVEREKMSSRVNTWYKRTMRETGRLQRRISDLKNRISNLHGQLSTSNDRIADLIDEHANEMLSARQTAEAQRRDLVRSHETAITRLEQERDASLEDKEELAAQLQDANQSIDSAKTRMGNIFAEHLEDLMVKHRACLAKMSAEYREKTDTQARDNEATMKVKDERISELEGLVASAEVARAERELRAQARDRKEQISEASTPSPNPPTTPSPPTTEPDQSRLESPAEPASDISSGESSSSSGVTKVGNPLTNVTSSSPWTPSRSAFSDTPRGSNESMWASREGGSATPVAPRPAERQYPRHSQKSKTRTDKHHQKSVTYEGNRYSTPKRSGRQVEYDTHDHR